VCSEIVDGMVRVALINRIEDLQRQLEPLQSNWVNGYLNSSGLTGEPSPSESGALGTASWSTVMKQAGVSLVRRHQGHVTISTGFLTRFRDLPGTFIALKEDHAEGDVMVTLSLKLPEGQWKQLEGALTIRGQHGSVDVRFVPTSPNEARPTTAEST